MKKFFAYLLISTLILSPFSFAYAFDVEDDRAAAESKPKKSGGNETLSGTLVGGLLGGGVGTAIGSVSGNAGKGALIGAGIGALGGALFGANQADKRRREERREDRYESQRQESQQVETIPANAKVKKKVIRKYDENGNVISEEEVKN